MEGELTKRRDGETATEGGSPPRRLADSPSPDFKRPVLFDDARAWYGIARGGRRGWLGHGRERLTAAEAAERLKAEG